MKKTKINLPFTEEQIAKINVGDWLLLSGTIYTARDAAHDRLVTDLKNGKPSPIPEANPVLYYAGPTPNSPDKIIGACGPTTSSRMDAFTPYLLSQGFKVCIGKGARSKEVREAIRQFGGLYLSALGGCGALYQATVQQKKLIAYEDLVSEAIYQLTVKDFLVYVETK
jgi:fumarate hydratase subunit beta